ncbi:MAG: 7TM domain-containing protein, partial [Acidobacteriota bacterium]
ALLIADGSVSESELALKQQQAAEAGLLLRVLRAHGSTEVVTEDDLTKQLIDARDILARSNLVITWTSGSVGSSVLSKFAQHIRQSEGIAFSDINIEEKGIIILSETPFGVLAPSAQAAFDQLRPSYILLTRPQALDLLLEPLASEAAKERIFASPVTHRLLGTFSARVVNARNPLNFISLGINYLVNRGVPINSITLVLMLPVIATILSFSRQVIGIKAFGLVTPAITTLSFLVMGLRYGLIVFIAVLLAGTLTRMVMRQLRLLYLPRMALVLTSVSISILTLFGIGVATNNTTLVSFSIFPILILTLLAEEFIALQFKAGARPALIVTAWTLALAIGCYFIVSWELLRTVIVSYPEVVLLAIPINILLGRWGGLRLTEYFRFRKLLRYVQ